MHIFLQILNSLSLLGLSLILLACDGFNNRGKQQLYAGDDSEVDMVVITSYSLEGLNPSFGHQISFNFNTYPAIANVNLSEHTSGAEPLSCRFEVELSKKETGVIHNQFQSLELCPTGDLEKLEEEEEFIIYWQIGRVTAGGSLLQRIQPRFQTQDIEYIPCSKRSIREIEESLKDILAEGQSINCPNSDSLYSQ